MHIAKDSAILTARSAIRRTIRDFTRGCLLARLPIQSYPLSRLRQIRPRRITTTLSLVMVHTKARISLPRPSRNIPLISGRIAKNCADKSTSDLTTVVVFAIIIEPKVQSTDDLIVLVAHQLIRYDKITSEKVDSTQMQLASESVGGGSAVTPERGESY